MGRSRYRRTSGDTVAGGAGLIGCALTVILAVILSCAGAQWLVYDAVIGYDCSGEGIEYKCVPSDLEPVNDAADDEVVPSQSDD